MSNDTAFIAALERADVPGAVALITNAGETTYHRAIGLADAPGGVAMQPDTLFQIASMTKAIVSIAALQLVERGVLVLDAPLGDLLPELAAPQVLEGFGEDGTPQLRPARTAITLRHLLLHTSGCGYVFKDAALLRYVMATGMAAPGSRASLNLPLLADPGERWEYGVSTDWVGLAIEAATGKTLGDYLAAELTGPLGMAATAFRGADTMPADAAKVHRRDGSGGFATLPLVLGEGEYHSGGGGLTSTASDYARFLRMVLNGGELDGVRVLSPETADLLYHDALAPGLSAGIMGSAMPDLAGHYDPLPGQRGGWTLGGFLHNAEPVPNGGRSAGSLHWAGIFNCYYWIDPARRQGGLLLMQLAPFGDKGVLEAFAELQRLAAA
ncbi:serine hydrolase domain-containing protein [Novosphingobium sp.]|uniref:serine hydrolase domain-containing protein n=1 Tax=Novosphingobium sp. TaxID=1874826 RepID=UPI0038BAAF76